MPLPINVSAGHHVIPAANHALPSPGQAGRQDTTRRILSLSLSLLRLLQYIQEEEEIVGRFLFDNRDIQESKKVITSFWKIREKIRKEKERNRQVM